MKLLTHNSHSLQEPDCFLYAHMKKLQLLQKCH